ncbi:purine-binding chemotaxis protein CheW [Desulfobotulus alkaliphilus]|uniref:Purine-binding chemotaxis protein CheW n=1 Tax=Desulfobotulus alkaliphilus TaxID=622671 RepID=A0A562R6W1_9BACT|nr:chemotaxis protein CheW [Desulfobotulus alkaliphilus]TWI64842.1 purine-binding chemotaxis protein CheW [Desulfobotulus alkaliphilus]
MNQHTADHRQICTFIIEGEHYGLDILDVKEVHAGNRFTPIHHAPETVKGYVNIRGQIHLIVDLKVLLGHPPTPERESTRILLFKPGAGEAFGVLVDAIGDVCPAPDSLIAPMDSQTASSGPGILRHLATGILKNSSHLVTLLSAKSILQHLSPSSSDKIPGNTGTLK